MDGQTDLSWLDGVTAAFDLTDDSLAPDYLRGESVLCKEVPPADLSPGHECVVELGKGRIAGRVTAAAPGRLALTDWPGRTVSLDVPLERADRAWLIVGMVRSVGGVERTAAFIRGGGKKKGRTITPNDPELGGQRIERAFAVPAFAC